MTYPDPVDPDVASRQLTALGLFFRAVDTRDWPAVESLLADRVDTDYSSVFGGDPEQLTRGDLVDRWRRLLPGFDATQHFVAPLIATGPDVWEGNVRGYHHLDGQTWMVAGWYRLAVLEISGTLAIASIRLTEAYEEGDRDLVARAQERTSR